MGRGSGGVTRLLPPQVSLSGCGSPDQCPGGFVSCCSSCPGRFAQVRSAQSGLLGWKEVPPAGKESEICGFRRVNIFPFPVFHLVYDFLLLRSVCLGSTCPPVSRSLSPSL